MRSAARFLRVLSSRTWIRGPSPGDGLVVNGVQESFHPWPGGHRDGVHRDGACQVRGVSDVEAVHFPAPIGSNPAGHNDRLGHDLVVHPGCAVSRIEEHLGVVQSRQDPVTELYDFSGRDTAQIRFYHDGEQRLINAPSPFQQGRGKSLSPKLPRFSNPTHRRSLSAFERGCRCRRRCDRPSLRTGQRR